VCCCACTREAPQAVNRQQLGQTEPTFDKFRHVPHDLRNSLRTGARAGAGRTLPVAVLLVVLVIVAAGIGGTSHFAGPRWYPNLGSAAGHRRLVPPTKVNVPPRRHPRVKAHPVSLPPWVGVLALVVILVGVAALLWRWFSRRRLPAAPGLHGASVEATRVVPVEPEPEPEPEALLTGIELALRELDEDRDPADAVVRAWLGLQETAEESGIVRQPAETPTEFTSRIMSRAFADDRAVQTLLRLYLRTRFGNHPVTANDVAAVHDALERLLANWRAADGATTTTTARR
jgi:hypothetical protein